MARPMKPLVRGGGYYPSNKWIPLVYNGGYTTMEGGEEPVPPPPPINWKTISGVSPLALVNSLAHAIRSLTQYGKCVQDGTPTPDAPVDIMCNNGRVVAGNCISDIPDGQGTFITPSELTTNRIYKAFPTDLVVGRSYTVTVTGTNWLILVQQKKPDGTGSSNVSGWVTTYDFTPEEGYIYGVAMRKSQDTITPADFNGTLTLDTTDGEPWTVGTPEVLTIRGENLLDPSESNIAIGEIYLQGGEQVSSRNNWRTGFIPIEGGKTYAFWGRKKSDNTISAYNRINWFDADGNNISPRPSYTVDTVTVGTAPSNAAFAGLSCSPNNSSAAITRATFDLSDWMFAEAAQEIPYEPYVTPQTVTDIPMLLGVGDYKDEQEILSGVVTRKVGVLVLDGTEAWEQYTTGSVTRFSTKSPTGFDIPKDSNMRAYCNILVDGGYQTSGTAMQNGTFSYTSTQSIYLRMAPNNGITTVEGWQQWLADQYAAGTPVIVVYPLATETTEQTTPHSLNSYEGTTVVDAQTNVDHVTLSVEYASSEE